MTNWHLVNMRCYIFIPNDDHELLLAVVIQVGLRITLNVAKAFQVRLKKQNEIKQYRFKNTTRK